MMKSIDMQSWTKIIRLRIGWFDIHPGELWKYRDLIGLFVWRYFVTSHQYREFA